MAGALPDSTSPAPQHPRECLWCENGFTPRRGGSPQLFCTAACRSSFHTAARRWAERSLIAGMLNTTDLRNGTEEACTLPPRKELPIDTLPDPALVAALRRRGRTKLELPIEPEAILDLAALGWMDCRQCLNPGVVADAVVDLASAALDAGLRPGDTERCGAWGA